MLEYARGLARPGKIWANFATKERLSEGKRGGFLQSFLRKFSSVIDSTILVMSIYAKKEVVFNFFGW